MQFSDDEDFAQQLDAQDPLHRFPRKISPAARQKRRAADLFRGQFAWLDAEIGEANRRAGTG